MELKVLQQIDGDIATSFQSHLYGIERPTRSGTSGQDVGFNRTFMELKVDHDDEGNDKEVFQSHLYGIESSMSPTTANPSFRFQSHLYGIES